MTHAILRQYFKSFCYFNLMAQFEYATLKATTTIMIYFVSVCNFSVFILCLFQCCQLLQSPSDAVKVGVSGHEIKENPKHFWPTARGVYTSFSSKKQAKCTECPAVHARSWERSPGYFKKSGQAEGVLQEATSR